MNKYYISEQISIKEYTALTKAREDIETCFKSMKIKKISIYEEIVMKNINLINLIFSLTRNSIKLGKNDCIFFQYPYYFKRRYIMLWLNYISKIRKVKLVAVIHDIDCLRYKESKKRIKREISVLNKFDYVICHNESMKSWLRKHGCSTNIESIGIFDYIITNTKDNHNSKMTDVVFAGNLDVKKSGFIYKLIDKNDIKCTMNLYGPNFSANINNENIRYKGIYSADELIENIEGKFGLIWDGENIDTCNGISGDYTKYNNPHKISMYIAAGIPVICWSKMAISEFVNKNKIGMCIDNLNEIDKIINSINEESYNELLENVKRIQLLLVDGRFTKNVLDKVIKLMEGERVNEQV